MPVVFGDLIQDHLYGRLRSLWFLLAPTTTPLKTFMEKKRGKKTGRKSLFHLPSTCNGQAEDDDVDDTGCPLFLNKSLTAALRTQSASNLKSLNKSTL